MVLSLRDEDPSMDSLVESFDGLLESYDNVEKKLDRNTLMVQHILVELKSISAKMAQFMPSPSSQPPTCLHTTFTTTHHHHSSPFNPSAEILNQTAIKISPLHHQSAASSPPPFITPQTAKPTPTTQSLITTTPPPWSPPTQLQTPSITHPQQQKNTPHFETQKQELKSPNQPQLQPFSKFHCSTTPTTSHTTKFAEKRLEKEKEKTEDEEEPPPEPPPSPAKFLPRTPPLPSSASQRLNVVWDWIRSEGGKRDVVEFQTFRGSKLGSRVDIRCTKLNFLCFDLCSYQEKNHLSLSDPCFDFLKMGQKLFVENFEESQKVLARFADSVVILGFWVNIVNMELSFGDKELDVGQSLDRLAFGLIGFLLEEKLEKIVIQSKVHVGQILFLGQEGQHVGVFVYLKHESSNVWIENFEKGQIFVFGYLEVGQEFWNGKSDFKPLSEKVNLQDDLDYDNLNFWPSMRPRMYLKNRNEVLMQSLVFMVPIWLKPEWPPPRTLRTRFFKGLAMLHVG